ncbi:LOW QUALITY PROTEIN: Hypothetical protein PHPALM_4317 [Phytophthora palmivora]|uniref:Gag protein n=1 Tax=Phytophthora palmivora TaxID=4796 RepID=A0A2P4YK77_9STRA|nr:LOW QUALITY PROTEIN: Hypothetical protein PHPALM_4317 [Phytophthora palmivora]
MRVLVVSLVGNPLPEHIKVTVFMDSLKVGPSRTQLFRMYARTATDRLVLLRRRDKATMRRQTQCMELQQLELAQSRYPWNWMWELGHIKRACPAGGQRKFSSKPRGSKGLWQKPRPKSQGNWGHQGRPTGEDLSPHGRGADGVRHGGLALRAWVLSRRGRLAADGTVARNGDKYADALRESEGRGQVSVRLADGTVVNVPGVRMDLAAKFEDFDSTESFPVLDMDKYDLILGMPWPEKRDPWIDWRDKAIGASRPAVSDRALVSNVPTSVRDWGARDGRQGAYAPEEVLGAAGSNEGVAVSLATGHEAKAHYQACGIATTASRDSWCLASAEYQPTKPANNTLSRALHQRMDDGALALIRVAEAKATRLKE